MRNQRLAYLLKKFPRLSETFILREILGQERLGRRIHVFSRRAPDDEPRHPELAGLEATVEVMPPSRQIDPWETIFSEDWDQERIFGAVGALVREARSWGHPRFPSLLAEALYLLRRTAELGIGHVHTHFATDSAVVAMILEELGGPSYSITAHAKDIYRNTVNDRLLDRMFARSRFSITVCDANVRHLGDRLSEAAMARVRRLYNGIDLSSFERAEEGGAGRDPHHVLAIGRLVEKKGFHVLLDALHVLRERGVPFTATLVGQGEEREALERQKQELGLGSQVELTGAIDLDGVRGLMARATIFCLPCVIGRDGNRDALPTVLVEALAAGLPSISTPVTGIPEILDDGAGVLVPENDSAATADAMEELLQDPERRAAIAEAGRLRAKREFDIDGIAATLGSWFEEALDGGLERCASPA